MQSLLTFVLALTSFSLIAQNRTVGTTQLTADAFDGYTLLAPIFTPDSNTIYMIDNCGEVVNTWPTEEYTGLVAKLLPNGNLLRGYIIPNEHFDAGGRGGGVQIWDWDGNKIWDYEYSTPSHTQHHDVTPMPDGSVLLLTWETRDSAQWIAAGRNPSGIDSTEVWTEKIVQVMPTGLNTGDIIWEWDAWDHLIQDFDASKDNYGVIADHPELMDINYLAWGGGDDDWMHANAIAYNENLDQIVMSCRHTHEIYVIDHSTNTSEAASHSGGDQGKGGDFLYRWGNPEAYDRGTSNDRKLFAQHDSHWIGDGLTGEGNIMIFNNGERPDTNYSTVDVIVPPVDLSGSYTIQAGQPFGPADVDWSYSGAPNDQFFSQFIAGAQRLPNGNTLICDGTHGRIFEINELEETVWEYVNPVNTVGIASQGETLGNFFSGTNNWVFRAYKYGTDYSGIPSNLVANGTVEQNPLPESLCTLIGISDNELENQLMVYPNPANDVINLSGLDGKQASLQLTDVTGRIVLLTQEYQGTINISKIPNGMYVLTVLSDGQRASFKILKE